MGPRAEGGKTAMSLLLNGPERLMVALVTLGIALIVGISGGYSLLEQTGEETQEFIWLPSGEAAGESGSSRIERRLAR